MSLPSVLKQLADNDRRITLLEQSPGGPNDWKVWVSGEYQPANSIRTYVNHNLNLQNPKECFADVLLVCKTAENGYSVGEFIGPKIFSTPTGGVASVEPSLKSNLVEITTGGGGIWGGHKTNGSNVLFANANWRYVFRILYR